MALSDTKKEWTRKRVLDEIREHGDTVLLSFSPGKDSLTAFVYLREEGFVVKNSTCDKNLIR